MYLPPTELVSTNHYEGVAIGDRVSIGDWVLKWIGALAPTHGGKREDLDLGKRMMIA